jgi:hypothetical protein
MYIYIYMNTLICHRVGSARNVCLVIGERLVIGISTLHAIVPWQLQQVTAK